MTWKEQLLDHGRKLGRRTLEHPTGVGIEFEDGHDVFWILPGEVTATLEVPAAGPESTEQMGLGTGRRGQHLACGGSIADKNCPGDRRHLRSHQGLH